jgi:hypothetical protein
MDVLIDETLKKQLEKFVRKTIKDRTNEEYDRIIEIIEETFKKSHLLSKFSNDGQTDIDESILYSILKAKSSSSTDEQSINIINFLIRSKNFL